MKKFKFKLYTPLKVKNIVEKVKKQELAEAITLKKQEEDNLRFYINKSLETRKSFETLLLSSNVRTSDLTVFNNYIDDMDNKIESQQKKVEQASEKCTEKRISFIKAKQEKEILEKLKSKQFKLYKQSINHEEQKTCDEIAVINYCRHKGDLASL